jgi:hypothetical protein
MNLKWAVAIVLPPEKIRVEKVRDSEYATQSNSRKLRRK